MKKKHIGQILKYAVNTSGLTSSLVAERIEKDRRTLTNYYKKENLAIDILIKIGQVINHDFSIELPELFKGIVTNSNNGVRENENSSEAWRDKYYELMEKHVEAVTQLNELLMIENQKQIIIR